MRARNHDGERRGRLLQLSRAVGAAVVCPSSEGCGLPAIFHALTAGIQHCGLVGYDPQCLVDLFRPPVVGELYAWNVSNGAAVVSAVTPPPEVQPALGDEGAVAAHVIIQCAADTTLFDVESVATGVRAAMGSGANMVCGAPIRESEGGTSVAAVVLFREPALA